MIFIIEDNKYAVNTRHSDRKSERYDFKKVFEGLGAGYNRADVTLRVYFQLFLRRGCLH